MSLPISIGVVGLGKIAIDQHLPALRADPNFRLTAGVNPHLSEAGLPEYTGLEAMFEAHPDIRAVSLCTPPQVRYQLAKTALDHGKHVFLEKPPGATLSEVERLRQRAEDAGVTLFASWHSRFAAGVSSARDWLKTRKLQSVRVDWREDVRRWHPGQSWIWAPGGLGVFDPGINALSIATDILPSALILKSAHLEFPENRDAPIGADLSFVCEDGAIGTAAFDWRQEGPQTWDIAVETTDGSLRLSDGGARLMINGSPVQTAAVSEYSGLYGRFAELIARGRSEVDVRPLQLVAVAFLIGQRMSTASFYDQGA